MRRGRDPTLPKLTDRHFGQDRVSSLSWQLARGVRDSISLGVSWEVSGGASRSINSRTTIKRAERSRFARKP